MYFIMTIDVESHSIALNRDDPSIVNQIHKEGLPPLLDLLSKYNICATFYFTGKFAEDSPESVEVVKANGHEIGCHGYDHSLESAFDILSYEEQKNELKKAKNAIEPVAGRVTSFRAPSLRINGNTVKALEDSGFNTDSSIASQRFDGPFTFGSKKKLKWLFAPRRPYILSYKSPIKEGSSGILEIPLSAFILPFIGTTMRISPLITRKLLSKFLYLESSKTGKPIVFLFHPNECLNYNEVITTRRSSKTFEYIFADLIRQKLKLENLGPGALKLLKGILTDAKDHGFDFLSIKEYRKLWH